MEYEKERKENRNSALVIENQRVNKTLKGRLDFFSTTSQE